MGDSLGDRMKGYERVPSIKLMNRSPVVIRLDGKAFHTYTRGCEKPFDGDLAKIRARVLDYLCENIQGCVLGYAQSDEISLVLKDWETYKSCAWFDNKVQKLTSVSASMCTYKWNLEALKIDPEGVKFSLPALFDSRCFNVPKEDVINYLVWRQQDWERNSVQMLARSVYSHKEMHGVTCKQAITKLEDEYGIIWGNIDPTEKLGVVWQEGVGLGCIRFQEQRQTIDAILNYTQEVY